MFGCVWAARNSLFLDLEVGAHSMSLLLVVARVELSMRLELPPCCASELQLRQIKKRRSTGSRLLTCTTLYNRKELCV